MAEPARKRWSYAEYLDLEDQTGIKHEFQDGIAVAMAGGSIPHAILVGELYALLRSALQGRPCRPMSSEQKLIVPETGLATYPDAAVYCGGLERHPGDHNALVNPTLLGEVLSKNTEAWDRGGKFRNYRQLPSLRYYLLVSQKQPLVELHVRQKDGAWLMTEHGLGASVALPDLGIALPVDELYAAALAEMEAEMRAESDRQEL